MFSPQKNPSGSALKSMIMASRHKAARRISDPKTGDVWCWPAEQATHRQGADMLGIEYDRPAGTGDILTL